MNFQARCVRLKSRNEQTPAVRTRPKPKQPTVIHRPESQQQKTIRQNVLQKAEARLETNRKIPLPSMMVVDLPDGSQILKKRVNDLTNVDIGPVLGHGRWNQVNRSDGRRNGKWYPQYLKRQDISLFFVEF